MTIPSTPSHPVTERPSAWVERFAGLVPSGEMLDLACGSGRHARLLASLGHPVLAVDRDAAALKNAAGPSVTTLQADLEHEPDGHVHWPFDAERFAGIIVTNYLHRPLLPCLHRSLAPGGILIYETFAQGNERFGKPSNPAFLLAPGELLDWVRTAGSGALRVIAYEDGYVAAPKPAMVQRICVIKAPADIAAEQVRIS